VLKTIFWLWLLGLVVMLYWIHEGPNAFESTRSASECNISRDDGKPAGKANSAECAAATKANNPREPLICSPGEVKFDIGTQFGCVGSTNTVTQQYTRVPIVKQDECMPIGATYRNEDGTESAPITKEQYAKCATR